jgi:hypothetical protein
VKLNREFFEGHRAFGQQQRVRGGPWGVVPWRWRWGEALRETCKSRGGVNRDHGCRQPVTRPRVDRRRGAG